MTRQHDAKEALEYALEDVNDILSFSPGYRINSHPTEFKYIALQLEMLLDIFNKIEVEQNDNEKKCLTN